MSKKLKIFDLMNVFYIFTCMYIFEKLLKKKNCFITQHAIWVLNRDSTRLFLKTKQSLFIVWNKKWHLFLPLDDGFQRDVPNSDGPSCQHVPPSWAMLALLQQSLKVWGADHLVPDISQNSRVACFFLCLNRDQLLDREGAVKKSVRNNSAMTVLWKTTNSEGA